MSAEGTPTRPSRDSGPAPVAADTRAGREAGMNCCARVEAVVAQARWPGYSMPGQYCTPAHSLQDVFVAQSAPVQRTGPLGSAAE